MRKEKRKSMRTKNMKEKKSEYIAGQRERRGKEKEDEDDKAVWRIEKK